jgi:hypothetical protein
MLWWTFGLDGHDFDDLSSGVLLLIVVVVVLVVDGVVVGDTFVVSAGILVSDLALWTLLHTYKVLDISEVLLDVGMTGVTLLLTSHSLIWSVSSDVGELLVDNTSVANSSADLASLSVDLFLDMHCFGSTGWGRARAIGNTFEERLTIDLCWVQNIFDRGICSLRFCWTSFAVLLAATILIESKSGHITITPSITMG